MYRGGSLHATLLVTNNDRGSIGQSLVDTLKTNANMSVQPASEAESQTLKRGGSTYALSLVIPADFSSRVMAGQASAIGILTILLMSALGGSWWPLDIVPDFMQKLGHITINAWALDGIRGLILHGEGFSDILPQAGVLFIYGSVCFIIGIKMFRFRNA
ncbi:MAG: ABC transporter permease [Thermoleophilia bacterium]